MTQCDTFRMMLCLPLRAACKLMMHHDFTSQFGNLSNEFSMISVSAAWFLPTYLLFSVMNGHLLLFIDFFIFLGSKNYFKLWLRNAKALCGFVLVCSFKIVWEENTIILLILITSNHLRIDSECFNVALWLYEPQIKLELDNITFDFSVRGNWAIAAAHIGTSKRKRHRRVNGGHRRSFKQMNPIQ